MLSSGQIPNSNCQFSSIRSFQKNANKKYNYFIYDSLKESPAEYKKSYEALWRRGILMIFDFWPKSAQK